MDWHVTMIETLRSQGHMFKGLRITDAAAQTVEIEPAQGVTQEQTSALQSAISAYPLNKAREDRVAVMQAAYAADLADGVEVGELTLAAGDTDQDALGHGLTILTAAIIAGLVTANTMISAALGRTVTDFAGASHDMTVGEYIGLCIGYGQTIGALQAQRNAKLAAIASAQTVNAVNAVTWS